MDSFLTEKRKEKRREKLSKKVASEVGRENMCKKIIINKLKKVEKTNYYI
jgi:hypothetical protein